ncbi:hypothetical protein HY251_00205 [bacterium]|nr:hypothetical protein [bacterium]
MSKKKNEEVRELLNLALLGGKYWPGTGTEPTSYVSLLDGGNHEVSSPTVTNWLFGLYHDKHGEAASSADVGKVQRQLEALAQKAKPHPTHYRVAYDPKTNAIYLDLANDDWEVVEVTAEGWEVKRLAPEHPIKFLRKKGMLPLAQPKKGEQLAEYLRLFMNLAPDEDDSNLGEV